MRGAGDPPERCLQSSELWGLLTMQDACQALDSILVLSWLAPNCGAKVMCTLPASEKVCTTTVETLPFFLFLGLRLYGVYPSFRTYGVYPFPLFSQENGTPHCFFLLCDLGVGQQTEKRGVPRWWCMLFFHLHCQRAMAILCSAPTCVPQDCSEPEA